MTNQETQFDHVADQYDAEFTYSVIGKLQREKVWDYLQQYILNSPKKLRILELNCGTGEDAIRFAKLGHEVWASDISEKMVAVTQQKIEDNKLTNLVKAFPLAAQKIGTYSFPHKFDLIFSNFGGLNCLSAQELQDLSVSLKNISQPNTRFIGVIMSSFCAWEVLYFLLKGKPKQAFRRRKKEGILASVGQQKIKTWYYAPKQFAHFLVPNFTYLQAKPIGITLPPSYMESFFNRHPNFLSSLDFLEKKLNYSALSNLADHYLIDLKQL